MKVSINTLEGAIHQLIIKNTGNIDFRDYSFYGSCVNGCKCIHFDIVEKSENECLVSIPALKYGFYKYQLFAKEISTCKEYLLIEGQIVAEDRLCDCSNGSVKDNATTVIDTTISADTVEVSVSIEKGAKGDKGDKGDAGVVDYSVLEPYATKEYVDAQMATVENTVQEVIENTKSDGYLTREDKMKIVQEQYNIDLSHYNSWVIYNEFGGVSAHSDNVVITEPAFSDIEVVDFQGRNLPETIIYGNYSCFSKEFINFSLSEYLSSVGLQNCPNLVRFHQKDVEE